MASLDWARWYAYPNAPLRFWTLQMVQLGQFAKQLYSNTQGYQMAKNLQAKLPPSDTVRLFDINKDAAEKLAREMKTSPAGGAAVEVVETAYDTAKEAV